MPLSLPLTFPSSSFSSNYIHHSSTPNPFSFISSIILLSNLFQVTSGSKLGLTLIHQKVESNPTKNNRPTFTHRYWDRFDTLLNRPWLVHGRFCKKEIDSDWPMITPNLNYHELEKCHISNFLHFHVFNVDNDCVNATII